MERKVKSGRNNPENRREEEKEQDKEKMTADRPNYCSPHTAEARSYCLGNVRAHIPARHGLELSAKGPRTLGPVGPGSGLAFEGHQ